MNMKMKLMSAACLAVCSSGAFAAVLPSCPADLALITDGQVLVEKCSPEVTFYATGATAAKNAILQVLTTDGKIFDKTKPYATLAVAGDTNQNGYYGYGAAGTSFAGKRVAVIYNSKNGSIAGVNQLLSKLKLGGVEGGVDQKEYVGVMQLHTAKEEKAGTSLPAGSITSSVVTGTSAAITLSATRVADFKTAWGKDKQKVAHMAFSDVRPSEATPGQVKKWSPAAHPAVTTGMQGFGVVVNTNLYNALIARDVAAGRLPSSCVAGDITPACQPSIYSHDYAALMTGAITTADALLGTTGDTKKLNFNRRPDSSGTQASTHIMFAGQAAYNAKLIDKDGSLSELVKGGVVGTPFVSGDLTITTHSGTGDLINAVKGDATDYAIGVASLDNGAASKFGAPQTARWVKVNGFSPDANAAGTAFDSKQRAGLQAGYPFAMEFQTLKDVKLAAPYLDIYNLVEVGLKDPSANLTGMAYLGSADAAKNTSWSHGGNNYQPLSKY